MASIKFRFLLSSLCQSVGCAYNEIPVEVTVGNPRGRNLGKESSKKKYQRDEKRTKHTLQELPEELMMGFSCGSCVSDQAQLCSVGPPDIALRYKKKKFCLNLFLCQKVSASLPSLL